MANSDLHARNAVPRSKPYRLSFGAGLLLAVQPSGSRQWLLRFMLAGRRREMGLGQYPMVSLAAARRKAVDARRQLVEGRDPLVMREAQRTAREEAARQAEQERGARERAAQAEQDQKSRTFRVAAEALIENQQSAWSSPKTLASWLLTLNKWGYPVLGDLPVADITRDDVTAALAPIWTTQPATATKLQRRIASILDYAKLRGWRVADNPATGRVLRLSRSLPSVVKKERRHASLPWQQVAAFYSALSSMDGLAPLALRFAILSGPRSNEVREAT